MGDIVGRTARVPRRPPAARYVGKDDAGSPTLKPIRHPSTDGASEWRGALAGRLHLLAVERRLGRHAAEGSVASVSPCGEQVHLRSAEHLSRRPIGAREGRGPDRHRRIVPVPAEHGSGDSCHGLIPTEDMKTEMTDGEGRQIPFGFIRLP